MSETETQWHVQVEEGFVKLWSLDQLDAAFKAGLIDESTFVLEDDGSTEWQTLGTLLGSDEPEVPAERPSPIPPQSYAPQSMTPASLTPMSFSPQSTSPMVADIDDDMPVQFRSKKRGLVVGMSLVAVAAGVALAGFKFGATASPPIESAPVAAAAPAPVVATPPPPETKADPLAAAAAAAQRFSDDQRRALLDADKAREAKVAEKQKARAAAAPHHHKSEKTPFHNGGAPGDPLNAKL